MLWCVVLCCAVLCSKVFQGVTEVLLSCPVAHLRRVIVYYGYTETWDHGQKFLSMLYDALVANITARSLQPVLPGEDVGEYCIRCSGTRVGHSARRGKGF